MSDAVNVLLVDDHPLVLSGLAGILQSQGYAVTTAPDLDQARAAMVGKHYGLLLLDINLARDSGLALLGDAAVHAHTGRVVMLSGITEQEWVLHGFELGAFGFVSKSAEPAQLLEAVAQLLAAAKRADNGWIWDSSRRTLVDAHEYFQKETILTPKERTVFMQMREGKLDKQIADELGLSIHTVRVHLRAIKRKRGHNRRSEQVF